MKLHEHLRRVDMTWTANARVTKINETPEGWSVVAEAHADRTYDVESQVTTSGKQVMHELYSNTEGEIKKVALEFELYSNTEGEIKKVALEFVVDKRPAFEVGDRIQAHGHFQASP